MSDSHQNQPGNFSAPASPRGVSTRKSAAFFLALLLALLVPPASPQAEKPKPQPEAAAIAPPTHAMTPEDVSAFLDGLVPLEIERDDIAGAVIAIVKDGKVIFEKGYGYADYQKKKTVSPADTLFRPGSISKLFIWTSVMQQLEQGKLDLNRDVNDYLDFQIPATYPTPITLRNIMTHTPGFEETIKDLFVPTGSPLPPLHEYLVNHLPARIFPPGTIPAYSNYATTMAGYIVQRVSGQPLDDYLAEHLFKPLAMSHSTFTQPLPASLAPLMSNGYLNASEGAKSFEFVEAWPAGALSTSADDMTHFMLAHLQDGQYGSARILKPETIKLMHSRQFTLDPRMNGMCLGFYEESRNGHRIFGHGGDTLYFHSDLHLMPDAQLGFFISFNSAGRAEYSPRSAVWEKFLDRYFPYTPPPATPPASAKLDACASNGSYMASRRSQTNFFRFLTLLGEVDVSCTRDGEAIAKGIKGYNGQDKKWREIGPQLFREVDGQEQVAFLRDATGRPALAIDFPAILFQKATLTEHDTFLLVLLIFAGSVLILTLLLWPVAALVRWHYSRPLTLASDERRYRLLVRLVCLWQVAVIAAWLLFLLPGQKDIGYFNSRRDPVFYLFEVCFWIAALATIIAVVNAWKSLRAPSKWWWVRIHDLALGLACLAYTWLLFDWHLLVFSAKY